MARSLRQASPEKKQPLVLHGIVVVYYYYDDHCTLNRREGRPGNTGDDEDHFHLEYLDLRFYFKIYSPGGLVELI